MTVTNQRLVDETERDTDRYLVVSVDSHCGPSPSQLREYCNASNLEEFDQWAGSLTTEHEQTQALLHVPEEVAAEARQTRKDESELPPRYTPGNFDINERLRHMDEDGVAAEVIYHGGQNGMLIPFSDFTLVSEADALAAPKEELALRAVGYRIYNRWLADWISVEPERHVGVAHVPIWNVDAATAETEWARTVGLTSINLPAPRPFLQPYNDRSWEPLWAVCEANEMPLSSHGGYAQGDYRGIESTVLLLMEHPFWGRRGLWYLIFGGVFERHPGLKFVITEQRWDNYVLTDMDSAYLANPTDPDFPSAPVWAKLRELIPRLPSDYFRTNCFIGASMLSHSEANEAIAADLVLNTLWGSDYPHQEGCWPNTRLSLQKTFVGIPHEATRRMLGANAVDVYGLDEAKLRAVANRIGPTATEFNRAPDRQPSGHGGWAFRERGKWS
jgi:predicted TIM-barrel fold metal-dependent hydrolase